MLKLSFKIILKWIKVYLTSLIQFLKISCDSIFVFSETNLATVSMIFSTDTDRLARKLSL